MLAKYRYLQWVFILLLVIVSTSFAGGWEQITELPIWRIGHVAAAVHGKIYVIGGFDHHKNLGGPRACAFNGRCLRHTDEHMAHSRRYAYTAGCAANCCLLQRNLCIWGL